MELLVKPADDEYHMVILDIFVADQATTLSSSKTRALTRDDVTIDSFLKQHEFTYIFQDGPFGESTLRRAGFTWDKSLQSSNVLHVSSNGFHIFVQQANDKTVIVNAASMMTVKMAKEVIAMKIESFLPGEFRLSCCGKELVEAETQADYNIQKGSIMQMQLVLKNPQAKQQS